MRRTCTIALATTIASVPVASLAETATYQYDGLGRLTKSAKQGGTADGTLTTIAMDAADNRTNYTVLNVKKTLTPGAKLYSSDNAYYLTLKANGQLAVVNAGTSTETWTSGTATIAGTKAAFGSDGNLAIYNASNTALWQTNSAGHPGAQLAVQTNGNLTITDLNSTITWQSNP